MISTHAPAGGATKAPSPSRRDFKTFLLTPLREGRPSHQGGRPDRAHFYSRPCGRGDVNFFSGLFGGAKISTHAPAGGATVDDSRNERNVLISTHAPAGGATNVAEDDDAGIRISTHAPAGGATSLLSSSPTSKGNFYSRPCGRGDAPSSALTCSAVTFLLTPLREGRQDAYGLFLDADSISTHAPAGGAT